MNGYYDVTQINLERSYDIMLYPDHSNIAFYSDGKIGSRNEFPPTLKLKNFIFSDNLKLLRHDKTPSGTSVFIFKSKSRGILFAMYPDDFVKLIKKRHSEDGCFAGKWTFKKKGPSVGLIMI